MADSTELFRQMADHTRPRCGTKCGTHNPDRCCSALYCGLAEKEALDRGITLPKQDHPRLQYMGPDGCVVPPHLRPLCTLHDCAISADGYDLEDEAWEQRYFELRDALNEALYRELGLSDGI